jgi:CBS domain-containing protein
MSDMNNQAVEHIPVRHVMTPNVLGIVPTAPLEVALRMMVEAGVHHLPVVDGDTCLGMLNEADVLWRLWSTDRSVRPLSGAVCRSPALFVEETDDVRTAARRMTEKGLDAAVVCYNGVIVGIVTVTNLLELLAGTSGPARPGSGRRSE